MQSRQKIKQGGNLVDDPRYGEYIGTLKKYLGIPTNVADVVESFTELSDKIPSQKLFPANYESQWIVDWSRCGTISIIDTDNERSQFKIEDRNGVYVLTEGDDKNIVIEVKRGAETGYRAILEEMGFSNTIQDFFVRYAHQGGFFTSLRAFHEMMFPMVKFVRGKARLSGSGITSSTDTEYSFKLESEKVVFTARSIISCVKEGNEVIINFSQPIEIEASVDILAGEDIKDENKMQDARINYFGFVRDNSIDKINQVSFDKSEYLEFGTQDKLKMYHSIDNIDSDFGSDDLDSGVHDNSSNDSDIEPHDSDIEPHDSDIEPHDSDIESHDSDIIVEDAQEEEETKVVNGMILFDDRFQKFDIARSDDDYHHSIKNSICCANQLYNDCDISQEKQSTFLSTVDLPVATLYYLEWMGDNEGKSFLDYFEAKKVIYQPILDDFILEARVILEHKYPKSRINEKGQLSEEEKTKKAMEAAVQRIEEEGGFKSIHHSHQQRQKDLKNEQQAKLIMFGAACGMIAVISSSVCFITAIVRAEIISSKVFPTPNMFNNPANVAILSVFGVLALIATIITASVFCRVNIVNEKIRSEEQNLHLAEPVVSGFIEEARSAEYENSIPKEGRGPTIN